jgi:hypothetical protein
LKLLGYSWRKTDQTKPNQQSVASLGYEAATSVLSVDKRVLEPQEKSEAGTPEIEEWSADPIV